MDEAVIERGINQQDPESVPGAAPGRWADFLWAVVILTSAGLITTLVLADIQVAIRPLLALWFILVCPGMALVRLLSFDSTIVEWTLAVTVSIILGAAVTAVILYLTPWSPEGGLVALAAISVVGAFAQLLRPRRREGVVAGAAQ